MPALAPAHPHAAPAAPPARAVAALRLAARDCRAAPRRSPGEACALLAPDADAAAFAEALARALPALLLRRPVIWHPGARGESFDEAWLAALLAALGRGDRGSARFLLTRRVRPGGAATLLFLAQGLLKRLDIP